MSFGVTTSSEDKWQYGVMAYSPDFFSLLLVYLFFLIFCFNCLIVCAFCVCVVCDFFFYGKRIFCRRFFYSTEYSKIIDSIECTPYLIQFVTFEKKATKFICSFSHVVVLLNINVQNRIIHDYLHQPSFISSVSWNAKSFPRYAMSMQWSMTRYFTHSRPLYMNNLKEDI